MGMARGKANVLAHLARASRGDYLMVCDADIRVNPQWVRSMLAAHQRFGTEAVTGSTVGAPGRSLWVAMQSLEWLYYMSIFKTLDTLGHSTAMGNNMSVRREAYEATGGYEALPFSVTEDYQLYCELMRRGFRHRVVFHAQVRNWSAPLPDWPTLLHQKKRWARGAVQLPPRIRVLMLVHALFFPALLLHAWLDPAEALFIGLDFVLAIWISLGLTARHLRLPVGPAARLVFPFWVMLINLIGPSFALARRKVRWKGREYA
jgi:cellulose synthase/poly-beta-1,6-N-acetylglucosamine synthase-like glycosyltransferase